MGEGIEVLKYIASKGGCMLSDLSIELGIPVQSIHGWIDLLCSTGYLKRSDEEESDCGCVKGRCACCSCSCKRAEAGFPVRIELTEKGIAMISRKNPGAPG